VAKGFVERLNGPEIPARMEAMLLERPPRRPPA